MKVFVACEFSGIVREAFRKKGHDARSCDLLPTEMTSKFHYEMAVEKLVTDFSFWEWKPQLMIAFPPCTHLAVSGARWFKNKKTETEKALWFIRYLMDLPINKIAIENPIGVISTRIREPDQIIQPWMFGHGETKATCLWLKNLPKLVPTKIVEGRVARVHREPPGPNRWKNRSRTYQGIADAMAEQWG